LKPPLNTFEQKLLIFNFKLYKVLNSNLTTTPRTYNQTSFDPEFANIKPTTEIH